VLLAALALCAALAAALLVRDRTVQRLSAVLGTRERQLADLKAEIGELHARLEERVRQRTTTLSELNDALQREIAHRRQTEQEKERLQAQYIQAQKMEAVGLLAGGIAHDFNNILAGIGITSEVTLKKLEPNGKPAVALRQILELAGRAALLTRQLLAFSRQQVLSPTVVSLNDLAENMLSILRRIIGEEVEIVFKRGAVPDAVEVDPTQIEQVILNLVVNARDAMSGGGVVTIETSAAYVSEPADVAAEPLAPGRYVELRVSDTGVGIEPAVIEHIFDPFYTTKDAGKGTGLGLATVYGIVRQHAGAVRVASAVGKGTSFRVLLPATEKSVPPGNQLAPFSAPSGESRTLLLIEDDDLVRSTLRQVLKAEGYNVLSAADGESAERMFEEVGAEIDVLVSDVVFPGGSGPELYLNRLKPRFPRLKVLFMSGYTKPDRLRELVLDEGIPFLEKPFTSAELVMRLARLLAAETPGPASPQKV